MRFKEPSIYLTEIIMRIESKKMILNSRKRIQKIEVRSYNPKGREIKSKGFK